MSNKSSAQQENTEQDKIKWLASFPAFNPWPIVEFTKDNELNYINPAAAKLFPDLASKKSEHPFLAGIPTYFATLSNTEIKNIEREVEVNDHWYLQLISMPCPDCLRVYASDITERKQQELFFQSQELRYRRLFEAVRDGILLVDFATGMILDVNQFMINLLGYSKADFLEKHLWDIGAFKDIAASKENFKELQTKGFIRYENLPLVTKDGRKIAVEFLSYAYKVSETQMIQLIQCNVADITERKKIQSELLSKEINYRRLFETAKDGILIIDAETGIILDVNQFLIDLLGYCKTDFLQKHLWDIGIFNDVAASKENFTKLQAKGYVRYENLPLETKSGGKVNVEFVSNIFDIAGKRSIQCNIRDITKRKHQEELLAEQTSQLKEMNSLMIEREMKMIELKKKIKELTTKGSK